MTLPTNSLYSQQNAILITLPALGKFSVTREYTFKPGMT